MLKMVEMFFNGFQNDDYIDRADESWLPLHIKQDKVRCVLEGGRHVIQFVRRPASWYKPKGLRSVIFAVLSVDFYIPVTRASFQVWQDGEFSQRFDAHFHSGKCMRVSDGYSVQLLIVDKNLEWSVLFLGEGGCLLTWLRWAWCCPLLTCGLFR